MTFVVFLISVAAAYTFMPELSGWLFLLMAVPSLGVSIYLGVLLLTALHGIAMGASKSTESVSDVVDEFLTTASLAVGTAKTAVETVAIAVDAGKTAVDVSRSATQAIGTAVNVASGKRKLPRLSIRPAKILRAVGKASTAAADVAERKDEAKAITTTAACTRKTARTKVVGVTHRNEDGSERQELVARHCRPGITAFLVHENDNPVDPNAVAVYVSVGGILRSRRVMIGYLKSELAAALVAELRAGASASTTVTAVTGGGDGMNRGVNLLIELK